MTFGKRLLQADMIYRLYVTYRVILLKESEKKPIGGYVKKLRSQWMQPLNTTLRFHAFVYFLALLLVPLFTRHLHATPPTTDLMLPKSYTGQEIGEQWLWSEKLDGIRGEWTGTEMLTKQGNKLDVPAYFTEEFPSFPLSGEIWGGRGTFERTSSIVTTSGRDKGWSSLRFGIFDSKDAVLSIEERIERVGAWFEKHPSSYAFVIEQ